LDVTRQNLVAYNSLGFYYAERGDLGQARSCFASALAINPANPASHAGLARVLLNQGKTEEAIAEAEQAARLDPNLAEAQTTLGQALMRLGRASDALTHYSEAKRLRPDSAAAHYNLANALARLGQLAPARSQYLQALALDPGLADAHNNLAYLLVREGNLEEAVQEFQHALKLQPDFWQARYGLGDALSRSGRDEEAIREFSAVVRQRPDYADGLGRLAWLLAASSNPRIRDSAQAVQLAERACKLTNQQQPTLLRTLSVAFAEAGRFADAVRTAELGRDVAQAAGQKELAIKLQELAEQFRAGRAFHEAEQAGPKRQ
jgi:tetratricopeptide (TPR) repeat protein